MGVVVGKETKMGVSVDKSVITDDILDGLHPKSHCDPEYKKVRRIYAYKPSTVVTVAEKEDNENTDDLFSTFQLSPLFPIFLIIFIIFNSLFFQHIINVILVSLVQIFIMVILDIALEWRILS